MRQPKTVGLSLFVIFVLGAVVAAGASAEEGFLLVSEKTGTLHGGLVTLETTTKEIITCLLVEGVILFTSASHGTGTLDYYDCSAAFLSFRSLGDTGEDKGGGGLVLARVLALVCLIPGSSLLFAIAIETDEAIHLEVFALGILLEIMGRIIGHVLPSGNKKAKKFEVDFTGAKGVPAIKECVDSAGGKKPDTYEGNTNHTSFIHLSQKVASELIFTAETELMD